MTTNKKEERTLDLIQAAWDYLQAWEATRSFSDDLRTALPRLDVYITKQEMTRVQALMTERMDATREALQTLQERYDAWRKWPKKLREAALVQVSRAKLSTRNLPEYANGSSVFVTLDRRGFPTATTNVAKKFQGRKHWISRTGTHVIRLSAEWIPMPDAQDDTDVYRVSGNGGLALLGYQRIPDAPPGEDKVVRACWIARERGNKIKSVVGWLAYGGRYEFHSTVSAAHALKGLERKRSLAAPDKAPVTAEQSLRSAAFISRGMVRRATGWCKPGVDDWVARWLGEDTGHKVSREEVIQAARQCVEQADHPMEAGYARQLLRLLGATIQEEQKTA